MNRSALNQNLVERVAMGDMLRRRARDSANREALVDFVGGQRRSLTYREFNAQANRIARGLRQQGLKQGDKLALMITNRIEFMTVAFACYKAGIILVPINFLQNPNDIRFSFQHAEINAVVFEPFLEELALGCSADLQHITTRISLDTEAKPPVLTLTSLMENQDDSEIEDIIINDRDTAQLIYTSGTTSQPKAVETSHLALYFSSLGAPVSIGLKRYHSHLVILPVFHCAALALCLTTFQISGKLVMQASFDPGNVIDLLEQEQIQGIALIPMMWKSLLMVPGIAERNFTAMETALYVMAPMEAKSLLLLRETFGCNFHLASGQTEFSPPACVFYDGSKSEFGEGNYWGVPTMVTDQAILDDHGKEVPSGVVGEICWRGPQVMSGYYKDGAKTSETSAFGWHHSGDLGIIDKEGQLLFVDRKKDMIKSGGENVASCKVEQALLCMAGIIQTAVFGVPHPYWSEAVCAAVILAPDSPLNEAEIITHCKKHLSGYEVPKRVLIVESLPITSTGKVKKQDLRKAYSSLFDA